MGRLVNLFSRRTSTETFAPSLSPFADVLPKVRRMREGCAWQPSATPASREQREERVRRLRRQVCYRGLPDENRKNAAVARRSVLGDGWWIALLVLGTILVGLVLNSSSGKPAQLYRYQHAVAPPFLSEQLALTKARKALSQSGLDITEWSPMLLGAKDHSAAPDGKRDTYLIRLRPGDRNSGVIIFEKAGDKLRVTVQLQMCEVWCTVSRTQ